MNVIDQSNALPLYTYAPVHEMLQCRSECSNDPALLLAAVFVCSDGTQIMQRDEFRINALGVKFRVRFISIRRNFTQGLDCSKILQRGSMIFPLKIGGSMKNNGNQ